MTKVDFAALPIDQMPPDDGNVSPIAAETDEPARATVATLERLSEMVARQIVSRVGLYVSRTPAPAGQ